MKRLIAILLSLLMLVGLCSCNNPDADPNASAQGTTSAPAGTPIDAQYIRTDLDVHSATLPTSKDDSKILLFTSATELDNYCKSGKPEGDSSKYTNLVEKCKKYNDAYFENKILVVLVVFSSTTSETHTVTGVTKAGDGKHLIALESARPSTFTTGEAYWHILIELDKNTGITSAEQIELVRTSVTK